MTNLLQTTAETSNPNTDGAYAWYLLNFDEITQISADADLLQTLQDLENELDLPIGTAERFKMLRDDATSVPETEEIRYATTWDAYHEALDSDTSMNILARVYGQRVRMPIYDRIDANGTFTV